MKLQYGFISVDDHVQEVPNLWTDRLRNAKWRDRAPHIESASDGTERWVVDGRVLMDGRVARAGALMADRNQDATRWADVPPAAFIPSERLKAMNAAGIDYSVLYPT